ncbi:MAG: DUF4349 domain-containing protein [Candidatus Shapirobacteria bacterium]|nr:DUF4349 domain-containing protein [Candidatus Shapirobacteria bacterium]
MITFLKKNWGWFVVIIILLFGQRLFSLNTNSSSLISSSSFRGLTSTSDSLSIVPSTKTSSNAESSANTITSVDRMLVENTNLSFQVEDVDKTIIDIKKTTEDFGGFMINSSLSRPEEAASGSISIRIPEDKKTEALDAFKKMAHKVVSENVTSRDITDEYQDLDARLEVLTKTKSKYEEILAKAEKISDILDVQQKLTSLQSQIDNIKGQQKYYEQSVNLTKITIYLSTDEIALPYAPTNTWEPKAIFKKATRSLVETFRSLGSVAIWGFVYTPIILPIIVVIRFIRKRRKLKREDNLA